MRCPYCHVHYLDEEKVCPMCGKRAPRPSASQPGAGSKSAGTKSKPKPAPRPSKPKKPAKSAPKQPPRPAPVRTAGSGWDAPRKRTAKKKRGCLFPFLILLVLFAVITLIANASFSGSTASSMRTISSVDDLLDSLENSDWLDSEDSVWYDSPIACMTGTWESQTTGDCITFHEDGTLTVSSGSVTAVCTEDDVFCRMTDSVDALSSDNRGRTEDYPPEDYVYCEFSMFPKDEDGLYLDSQTFDLLIFLPRDLYESGTPPEPGAEIAAFHYDEIDRSADSYLDTYVMQ